MTNAEKSNSTAAERSASGSSVGRKGRRATQPQTGQRRRSPLAVYSPGGLLLRRKARRAIPQNGERPVLQAAVELKAPFGFSLTRRLETRQTAPDEEGENADRGEQKRQVQPYRQCIHRQQHRHRSQSQHEDQGRPKCARQAFGPEHQTGCENACSDPVEPEAMECEGQPHAGMISPAHSAW